METFDNTAKVKRSWCFGYSQTRGSAACVL